MRSLEKMWFARSKEVKKRMEEVRGEKEDEDSECAVRVCVFSGRDCDLCDGGGMRFSMRLKNLF